LFGCSSLNFFKSKEKADPILIQKRQKEIKKTFNEAVLLLDREEYKASIKKFNYLLKQHPTTSMQFFILFNMGVAYEGMGHCGSAANRYRKIVSNQKGTNEALKARSLLRLSYTYECLKKDTLVVATLHDAIKKEKHLSKEVALAEIPARLAAAYSRLGNSVEAKRYFKKAQQGLKVINRTTRNKTEKKDLLAKTYYFMGDLRTVEIKGIDDTRFVEHLKSLQTYLLRSVELNVPKWSTLSANQILDAYDSIVGEILKHHKSTSLAKNSAKKQSELSANEELSLRALQSIDSLISNRFPDDKEAKVVSLLFTKVQERKRKIEISLASLGHRTTLTQEALRRKRRMIPTKTVEVPGEAQESLSPTPLPKKKK